MFMRCDEKPTVGSGPHRPGQPGHVKNQYFDTTRTAIGFSGCAHCLSRCKGVLPVALRSADVTMVAVAFFIEGGPSPVMTLYQSHWRRVITCCFMFKEAAKCMSVREDPLRDQSIAPRYAFVLDDIATGGGNRLVPATGAFADIQGRQPGRANFDPVAVYVGLHNLLIELDVETAMAQERRALVQASEQALRQEPQPLAMALAQAVSRAVAPAFAPAFAPAESYPHDTEEGSDSSDENESWIEKSMVSSSSCTVDSSSGCSGTIGSSGRDRRGDFSIQKSPSTQHPV